MSALAFQAYAMVPLAKAPEQAKRRRKCVLGDARKLRAFRDKHCGDDYWRRLREACALLRETTGRRGCSPLNMRQWQALLGQGLKNPPTIQTARKVARDLARAGVAACDRNAVRWLLPSERGSQSQGKLKQRAKTPYIGPDSPAEPKPRVITLGSSAAPARRAQPLLSEPLASADLDAIDDELAALSLKQTKLPAFQPLCGPSGVKKPEAVRTEAEIPDQVALRSEPDKGAVEERKAERLVKQAIRPCQSCQESHKAQVLAANPSAGDIRKVFENRAKIARLTEQGLLGRECAHNGRAPAESPEAPAHAPPRPSRGLQVLGFCLSALVPPAPEPEPEPEPEPPPPPVRPPPNLRPWDVLVEWKGRQLFFHAPTLRKLGIGHRDLLFAASRLERRGMQTDGALTGRIIAYARKDAAEAKAKGFEPIPEPETEEEAARDFAPRYFARFGTGNRTWRIWPRGRA